MFQGKKFRLEKILLLSPRYVSANRIQVLPSGFDSLFGIVARHKSRVIIEGQIALPPETVEDRQQRGMLLVDVCSNEVDNCDVVSRLASSAETIAEHVAQGSLEHCFVGLLKTRFLIKRKNFAGRGEFLIRTGKKTVDLRPVNGVRLEFFHSGL